MTALHYRQDLTNLKKFIRKNHSLLHLDFSGMFKTAEQVKSIVKAFKKHQTLLAVHLSHTPFIVSDTRLQSYIRTKLDMFQLREVPSPPFSTNEVLKERLQKDWILRDKLQSECNVVEKVSEYYRNQRVNDASTEDSQLILQRTIGYSSLKGNQEWIAKHECYICDRWQMTFFLYKPDTRESTVKTVKTEGTEGTVTTTVE